MNPGFVASPAKAAVKSIAVSAPVVVAIIFNRDSSTPLTLARKATRLVHTNHCPATRAHPLGLFIPDKTLYPRHAYRLEIVDHAHAVIRSVTLIQVYQQLARKARTVPAVTCLTSHPPLTILDSTGDAGLRFDAVVAAATRTSIPSPQVCAAQRTVHPTGSDQRGRIQISRGRFSCHAFPLGRHALLWTSSCRRTLKIGRFNHHSFFASTTNFCSANFLPR